MTEQERAAELRAQREEFEKWAKAHSLPLDLLTSGEYAGYQVHTAWLAWSARDAELSALTDECERLCDALAVYVDPGFWFGVSKHAREALLSLDAGEPR